MIDIIGYLIRCVSHGEVIEGIESMTQTCR